MAALTFLVVECPIRPIEGATIVLDGLEIVTVDGVAEFEGLEKGLYDYTISKPGYTPFLGTVNLDVDWIMLSIELKKIVSLPTVNILSLLGVLVIGYLIGKSR